MHRPVPLKSENEEKLWSTLETRLYGDPNRQQAMPGIYVPHRNFVLVNAPAAAEDEEEKETEAPEPKKGAPAKPMTQTRKSWIKNLMEKKRLQKKKKKRDAETFVSDSEHSEIDSPANERSKFRKSVEGKFDSSASEMSDGGYHSASSTRRKPKAGKSRNRKIVKARRNNRSGNYSGKKGKSLTDTELNELDNFAFDEQTDNLNLDLHDDQVPFMQDSLGASKGKKSSRKKKTSHKDLKKMEKYWERETQKAEDDLSKFVLDFSNSLKEKEGSDQLVLDTFFEDDDIDVVEDGALNSSLQFNERTLMTSLDVDASLTSSLHDPNEGEFSRKYSSNVPRAE